MKSFFAFIPFIIISLILVSACSTKKIIPLTSDAENSNNVSYLVAPIQFELIYHNGSEKDFTPVYRKNVTYSLLPGNHIIGFRYQEVHYDEYGNHDVIKSKPSLIQFEAKLGKTYNIMFETPINYQAATNLESQFIFSLKEGAHIIATSESANNKIGNTGLISGIFSSNKFESFPDWKEPDQPQATDNATAHLKYWWESASTTERENFRQWIRQN